MIIFIYGLRAASFRFVARDTNLANREHHSTVPCREYCKHVTDFI